VLQKIPPYALWDKKVLTTAKIKKYSLWDKKVLTTV
jgi:hypothetical protein